MMPARKQEKQPEMGQADSTTQPVGFGKVLTSIHGLQRRLDDFSVDDVSEVDAKARTLIRQLSLLQEKLATLTAIKRFLSAAAKIVGEIPEMHFEQVDLDGLESHPKLHAIIQASKLIRLHRLMQAAKAGADSVSFDAEAGMLRIAASATAAHTPGATRAAPEVAANETAAPSVEPNLLEAAVALQNDQRSMPEEKQWEFSADVEPPAFHDEKPEGLTDGDFRGPQFPAQNEQISASQSQKPAPPDAAVGAQEKSSAGADAQFDRRLLSDLIEAYGEFLPSPLRGGEARQESNASPSKASAVKQAPAVAAPASDPLESRTFAEAQAEQLKANKFAVPALIEEAEPPAVRKIDLPARLTPKLESPRAGEIITLPAHADAVKSTEPETAKQQTQTIEEKVPRVRKQGELDRQLKRIIKDYGEYDLYSHQGSGKFRTSVIAAFVLLGLLLGGFYFFKAPAPSATPVTPAPQSQAPSSASADQKP